MVTTRRWEFDLDDWTRPEPDGWSFGWTGQRLSSPCRYLIHTDGRSGVTLGGPFLEVSPSIYHLIEGHALMGQVADRSPVTGGALETWVPGSVDEQPTAGLTGLRPVPETSGPYDRWLCSDTGAVRQFAAWTDAQPRATGVMAWRRHPPT